MGVNDFVAQNKGATVAAISIVILGGFFYIKNRGATSAGTPTQYSASDPAGASTAFGTGTSILVSSAPTLSPEAQQQGAVANIPLPVAGLSSNATGGIGGLDAPMGQAAYGGNGPVSVQQVGPGLAMVNDNGQTAFYEPLGLPSVEPTILGV